MKKILCDEQFGAVTHALPSAASFSTITYKFRHPEATSGCRDLSRGVYNRKQTASSTSTIFVRRRSLAGQQEWQKKKQQQLPLLLSSVVCAPRLHLREPAAVMKLLQWTKCAHLLQLSCNGALTGSSTIHWIIIDLQKIWPRGRRPNNLDVGVFFLVTDWNTSWALEGSDYPQAVTETNCKRS
jgi:hypothetical protein